VRRREQNAQAPPTRSTRPVKSVGWRMLTPCLECGALSQGNHRPHHKPAPSTRTRPASSTKQGCGSDWQRTRIEILQRDQWTCAYSGKPRLGPDATVDHVIPTPTAPPPTPHPSNLVACSKRCNSAKANEGRTTHGEPHGRSRTSAEAQRPTPDDRQAAGQNPTAIVPATPLCDPVGPELPADRERPRQTVEWWDVWRRSEQGSLNVLPRRRPTGRT